MTVNKVILILITGFMLGLFVFCRSSNTATYANNQLYLNHSDTVKYIGSESCRACHQEIYESFAHTGMGESFGLANPAKSASIIEEHTQMYDSINNYYYKPFWKNDSLMVKEFRLENKDTTYSRTEHIKYIIGSGHHTNSHIFEQNGFLYQAPITFYTQKKIWDFAPGFSGGFSTRFDRIIGTECMNCHNSFGEQPKGSENKYDWVAGGISCERCHGPGEAHLKLKTEGEIIDTSKYIDYSIVNPAKLDRKAQMQVCQRCHVQGISVLKNENTFYDFKPGQALDTVMDVFLPRYTGANDKFIMASQADRLMQSACYKKSDMTCISCHNPHISTRVTPMEHFIKKCQNCHASDTEKDCQLNMEKRLVENDNCATCHMPESPSIDIPHVTVTDHLIRVQPSENEKVAAADFVLLENVISKDTDPAMTALGYLSFFEKFTQNAALLDSAAFYLKGKTVYSLKKQEAEVWLNFIEQNYKANRDKALKTKADEIKDAWTCYRLGASLDALEMYAEALPYLKQAIDLQRFNLDFQNKYGALLLKLNKFKEAKNVFDFIISENNQHISGLTNLGFVYLNMGNVDKAEQLYNKALTFNPDYIPALLNKVGIFAVRKNKTAAKQVLDKILKIDPGHQRANFLLKNLDSI